MMKFMDFGEERLVVKIKILGFSRCGLSFCFIFYNWVIMNLGFSLFFYKMG